MKRVIAGFVTMLLVLATAAFMLAEKPLLGIKTFENPPNYANSTIGTLSPVVTLFLAVLILDEPLRGVDLLGTALVVGGVGLFTVVDRRHRR